MKRILLSVAIMAASFTSFAQVGIGTTNPEASAVLDISSTTKALLITRVSDANMTSITAVKGMVLYNTTQNKFLIYQTVSGVTAWYDMFEPF